MRRLKLDRIDKKILCNLQADGRMSNVDLAQNVGISAPPCLRRVRALETAGFITGYNAALSSAALGYNVIVFALVKLSGQAAKDKAVFEEYVNTRPKIRECHLVAGDIDYILKIVAKDWDDYQDFLKNDLTHAPTVTSVKTCLSMNPSKNEPGLPIDAE